MFLPCPKLTLSGRILSVLSILVVLAHPAQAQVASILGETETTAPVAAPDIYGRDTPRSMMFGFLDALAKNDYERAGHYLQLPPSTEKFRSARGRSVATELETILDRAGAIDGSWGLSSLPEGSSSDGLPPDQEKIGSIRVDDGDIPILAVRSADGDQQVWQVSQETLQAIPAMLAGTRMGFVDRISRDFPAELTIMNIPAAHWIFAILVSFLIWLVMHGLFRAIFAAMRHYHRKVDGFSYLEFLDFTRPALVAIGVSQMILPLLEAAGVSVILRGYAGPPLSVILATSIAWLALRIVQALSRASITHAQNRGMMGSISFLVLMRRVAKSLIVFIASLLVLDAFGIDLTAGLAALGIGGIAIALGSQKTIEHFVGSLSVIADRPVRIGDFCRFGTISGTVEDIGMRSTMIRTLDRTRVSIPNGIFSASDIENYTARDKYLFHHMLPLPVGTSAGVIRTIRDGIAEILQARVDTDSEWARVRLVSVAGGLPTIEVFIYLLSDDFPNFLKAQEELLLSIIAEVARAGSWISAPTTFIQQGPGNLVAADEMLTDRRQT